MEKTIYIYFRESAAQSIVADFVTYLFLGLMFAFNYFYLGDSKVTAFFFFLVFIMFTIGKVNSHSRKFTSIPKLKEYVESL